MTRRVEDDRLRLDLHVLPSGPVGGSAGGPDAEGGLRLDVRGDCLRVFDGGLDGAPSGSCEGRRNGTRGTPTGCRPRGSTGTAWRPCSPSSISSSTKGIRPRQGESLTRPELSGEAIRLGRLVLEFLPEPEVTGLLALMLLQSRGASARTSPKGELILLDEQDRSLWDRERIAEGVAIIQRALAGRDGSGLIRSRRRSPRCMLKRHGAAATDWGQIVGLYSVLARMEPSPVVEFNRAVAVAMRVGPAAGLELIDARLARGELGGPSPGAVGAGELCRRLGGRPRPENRTGGPWRCAAGTRAPFPRAKTG